VDRLVDRVVEKRFIFNSLNEGRPKLLSLCLQ
jgi:hypothetical protein